MRPLPKGAADTYELVAGARRYRASKLAQRETIPATVRELTDAQSLELQVIENVQRVDVHPLDEAQGYAALIELQPETYTVESIASRVGRSPAYVSGRLRLIQLIPEAKQAFYDDKLTVAHAFEIARLQPNDQRRALQECFPQYRNSAAILKDKKAKATARRRTSAIRSTSMPCSGVCWLHPHYRIFLALTAFKSGLSSEWCELLCDRRFKKDTSH